jgi:uncharacterized membrane protein YkoI
MSKKHLFGLILLLCATLPPPPAIADITEMPAATQDRAGSSDVDTHEDVLPNLQELFRSVQVPLSQAMVIAESLHIGSRTAEISFEVSDSIGYRVRTVKKNQVWENVVDANTGSIAASEIALPLKELDREDRGNILALTLVEQELSDAVRVAEKATSGKALSGGLVNEDGKLNFVIVVVSGDVLKQVLLEPPRVHRQASIPRP